MGTLVTVREFQQLTNRVMFGRGVAKPADTSFYVGLLTTGLTLTAASTASTVAAGEVAAANGYARQLFGRQIASMASNTITTTAIHNLANGTIVNFITTGSIYTGLTVGTDYFVVNAGSTSLQVSATLGGSAIALSGGSGTHYIKVSPVYDTGADNRSEAIEDSVIFAPTGDITYQGYFLMCNTTGTRGDASGSTLVGYEYFGTSQVISGSSGDSRIIRFRAYTSNQGIAAGL